MFDHYCTRCTTEEMCLENGKCFMEKVANILGEEFMDEDDELAEVSDLADDISELTSEADYFVKREPEDEDPE